MTKALVPGLTVSSNYLHLPNSPSSQVLREVDVKHLTIFFEVAAILEIPPPGDFRNMENLAHRESETSDGAKATGRLHCG